jgi:hypothetical protein
MVTPSVSPQRFPTVKPGTVSGWRTGTVVVVVDGTDVVGAVVDVAAAVSTVDVVVSTATGGSESDWRSRK